MQTGSQLELINQKNDLEIGVNGLMKTSSQCIAAVLKEASMLELNRKRIENRIACIILLLNKSMVQLHLECHVSTALHTGRIL